MRTKGRDVGAIYVTIDVGDMRGERFEPVEVMVDTGSTFTTVPADLLRRLGVNPQRTMQVRLADGSVINDQVCDTVIRLEGQTFFTPISFGREGEPSLLGVVALETALLAVDPVEQRLVPTIGWKA
jgi:predicted aspartyl protease